jgi:hypothetical protein
VQANVEDLIASNMSVNAFYGQIDATNLGYGANEIKEEHLRYDDGIWMAPGRVRN